MTFSNDINERGREILAHVARFRLTTLEAIEKVVLPELSRNAISKIVTRLCERRALNKFTLLHPMKYFVVGDRTARTLGLSSHRSAPLGPQSLPQEYAVLAFASLGTKRHVRLTQSELQKRWSWLTGPLASATYCLDQDGVLELTRVDLGGPADHVARKCADDLGKRCRIPEFLELLKANRFRLVVITSTSGKVTAIQRSLDLHTWPRGLQIHFSIVPQLLLIGVSTNHA